ncbi:purine/pyrimidine permease [Salirhabdus salicampi]|uniref:purine/pyrimidine permease n=1 Tax=Salirhabdus salicampi TaxID=476102 RepID=UPI0020C46BB2|nr:purine/pyrimidine permease [Salirhabdus salicampi]MCP8617178.1 purine/pyrimidine permease [Salirhabdus salicampi]
MGSNISKKSTFLETMQWFVFLLASSIALPIVIGTIFEMSLLEISGLMQRTFFIVGISCFLQGVIGHRLPIVDGPAGLWISMFAVYATIASQKGVSFTLTLRELEMTMILTGICLVLMGVFRLAEKVIRLFNPLITGAFLFMLTIQLSGTFLKGMLGIDGEKVVAQLDATLISFFVFFFVLGFSILWKGPLKNYAVLIGVSIGWILHGIIHKPKINIASLPVIQFPELFAWGAPKWDWGSFPIAILIALILLSNIVGSLAAANQVLNGSPVFTHEQMNRGSYTLGLNHGISALFSGVAVVTLASSSGFMDITGQKRKKPFMYASILLIFLALFPPIVSLISMIPSPVANAALLATFVQLMGIGLSNIANEHLDQRKLTMLSISFLVGIGLMFMPSQTFQVFPELVQSLLSNGLLVGTVLIILLDQMWKDNKRV